MDIGNPRKYRKPPYSVVLVHGGPGAAGEMKPVAEELAADYGVLEPFQTKKSINGQVEQLKSQIEANAKVPVTLIGYSWGAWLAFILAAKHPSLVKKLVMVGSGPFEAKYARGIMDTRLSRLSDEDRRKVKVLMKKIQIGDKSNETLIVFGKILSKADLFDPISKDNNSVNIDIDIYQKVWPEADKLRKSGELLELGKSIRCPVVVIHGDYDPHPYDGVLKPLKRVLKDVNFILLKNCGHTPWKEKEAKREFYKVLRSVL